MPYVHESTPQKEAEIAQQALESGDLQHAIYHIGTALQFDPLEQQWLSILDEVLKRTPDALTLVRMDDRKSDVVTLATRGYVLAHNREFQEALSLVAQAAALKPEAPFLQWAIDWVQRTGVPQSLSVEFIEEQLLPGILKFVTGMPSPADPEDARHRSLVAAHNICAALGEAHPKAPFLLFARSVIARRLSQLENAIVFAYEAFQIKEDWRTAVGVAMAYRDNAQVDEAVGWFRYAISLDPEDISPLLDIGDTYLDGERCSDAIAAYEEVLERKPGHSWAEPSIVYARYRMNDDEADKKALFELAERSGRAWELFCRLQPPEAYVNMLPPALDATANGLRDTIRNLSNDPKQADGGSLNLKVTHPESPSVLTAFRLWTEAHEVQVDVNLEVETVQTPDPRTPKWKVDFLLWEYDETQPRPNCEPPDPRAAEAIAAIAKEPYNLEFWDPQVRELAAKMGPAWLQQILQTMIHPPPLPSPEQDPMAWVQKVQIAAALVAGYVDSGWEQSHRKRALYSLVLGPVDWTVDAGVVALGWLARQDPTIRTDAERLFDWLKKLIPEEGYTCFEYPLVCTWLGLGDHDDETLERLTTWRTEIEQRSRAAPDSDEPEIYGGLTLEQYADLSVQPDYERIAEWDDRINRDPVAAEKFFAMQNDARLKLQGIEFNSQDGRVAEMIRVGAFDTEGAMVNAQAAAEQIAAEEDAGDPDPVVFPGQPVERLSQYVTLMKGMQAGDMMGALAQFGLDMGTYAGVAQAWGVRMAGDPILTAKFQEMMGD